MFDKKTILVIIITAIIVVVLFALAVYSNLFCKVSKGIVINKKCYKLPKEFYDVYTSFINYYYIKDNKYYESSRLNEYHKEISKKEYIEKFILSILKIDERQK